SDHVDVSRGDVDSRRAACLRVATTYVDLFVGIGRLNRGAQFEFQSFGCLYTNSETAMTTQSVHDGDVDVGAAHPFSTRSDDRSTDDCGNVCCTTADIYHCGRLFIIDW